MTTLGPAVADFRRGSDAATARAILTILSARARDGGARAALRLGGAWLDLSRHAGDRRRHGRLRRHHRAARGRVRRSNADISSALAIRLALYGLVGSFAAALINRIGARPVVGAAISLIAIGASPGRRRCAICGSSKLFWGVIVGLGSGIWWVVLGAHGCDALVSLAAVSRSAC